MDEITPSPERILSDYQESNPSYFRHFLLFAVFMIATPITLFASIITLKTISPQVNTKSEIKGVQIYAALPVTQPGVSGTVIAEDARVRMLSYFLERNRSELTPHASYLVETADKYGLDWKLLPAIAQKESGLCRVIPPGSHNCWGWGIHSKGTLMFDSYEESIDTVAKGLKEKYIDMGYTTPEKIMKKYAHPSSTTWADGVIMYMNQIENVKLQ